MDGNIQVRIWISCSIIGRNYRSVKMKKIILSSFFFFLLACNSEETLNGGGPPVHELKGVINESGVDVEISFFAEDTVVAMIKNGSEFLYVDTTRKTNVPSYECGLYINGCDSAPIDVEIRFMTEPKKCLVYLGNIKNKQNDIRSIESYKKVDEAQSIGPVVEFYQFYITTDVYKNAKSCN